MTDTTARKAALAGVFDRAAASYDRVDIAFFGPAGAELAAVRWQLPVAAEPGAAHQPVSSHEDTKITKAREAFFVHNWLRVSSCAS